MTQASAAQLLKEGLSKHRAGRLAEARADYEAALQIEPMNPDALHLLGMVRRDEGKLDEAIGLIRRAIQIKATAVYLSNLGNLLAQAGKADEAIGALEEAVKLRPEVAEIQCNLGAALRQGSRHKEALVCYQKAIELRPDFAEAWVAGAGELRNLHRLSEAEAAARRALELSPQLAEAHQQLGIILREQGRLADSVGEHEKAIELKPGYAEAYHSLGIVLRLMGNLEGSVVALRKAVELQPNHAAAHCNLGVTLKDQGLQNEAAKAFSTALHIAPGYRDAHSNFLANMYFCEGVIPAQIVEAHRRWAREYAEPLKSQWHPHPNEPSPDRRLRIGYVSSDFGQHPVGRFLIPLYEHHDHANFEIYSYACNRYEDSLTADLRKESDQWRQSADLSEQQLAEQIRLDKIDILVDLSLHMAGNRLLAFARKPAPVQVSYLGYAGTTGMDAIDYRITDPFLDPVEMGNGPYSEESVRIASYWCYRPHVAVPEVGPLPLLTRGHVTFGCFNNFSKVTESTLAAWAVILKRVPGSHLQIHAESGSHRQRVKAVFEANGVDANRVDFVSQRSIQTYFSGYNAVDIALDPFPYNGGTTTCDALWMGVPVVTLSGASAVARAGTSLVNQVGLGELAAKDTEGYVSLAVNLALDTERLKQIRGGLRDRMRNSPLCDAAAFAREMERAYRWMWRRWCQEKGSDQTL